MLVLTLYHTDEQRDYSILRSSGAQPEWEWEKILLGNHMNFFSIELPRWSVSNELTRTVADESELSRPNPMD